MKDILSKLVDASFELGYRLVDTRYKIEKIVVSNDALIHLHGDRLRFQEPMAKFGVGKSKVCDIPIELDDKQKDDFKFVITIKAKR